MPISQKIQDQIKNLNASKEEKELLRIILEHEDRGIGQYKKTYSKEINDYIDKTGFKG